MAKQPTKLPSIPNLSQLSEAGRALSPPVVSVPIDELSKERLKPKKEPVTTPLGRPIVKPFAPDVQQRIEERLSEEADKEIAEIDYSAEPIDRAYQMDVEEEGLLDEVLDDAFLKMTAPEPFVEDLAMGVSSPVKKKPSAKDITRYLNLNLGKYGIVFDVDELNNIEARAGDKSIKVDLSSGFLKSSEGQRSEIKRLKDFVVKEAVTPEVGVSISNENRIKNELAQELGVNQREAYDVYNRRKSVRNLIKYIEENEQNESAMASLEKKYKKGRFELLQDLKKEAEDISPTADAYERDYILEVDKRLEAQVKESTAQAIKLRNIGESLTKSSADRFKAVTGVDLTPDNVKNLKFANKDQYDSVTEILNDYAKGVDVQKQAFNKYEDAKMYFDQKTNKQIQEETVGFIEGVSNSIKNAYYSTKGAKEYVKYASGLITQEEANKRMAYYSSKPQLPLSKTQLMLMQRMEEEGTFDFLGYLSDPTVLLPAATTLAADALTQMITMTGGEMLSIQAAGGVIGAGVGLLATKTPAGAAAGFRAGMSAAGTFNAYVGNVVSNVALEVGLNVFQAMKEKYTPEQIRRGEWVNDPEIEDKAMKGLIKGGAIAGTEIILQAMLDKFRISSIASAANRVSRTVVKNAAFETIQEGGGEAIGQLAAYGELNGNEVVAEMLGAGGMVASNPFGFYREVYMQLRNNYYEDLADNMSKSRAFINNTGDDINKVQEWTGNMRKLGKITEETERKIVENIADIRQARIALSSLDDTDAQRTKTIEKGTNTKAEDRLADLYAAKRKLERTPALNKPLQQSIQNEIDNIVLNKKVPKEVLNLSPIIGTGPVYRVDGEYVGKRYLDMIVKRMPPSVLSRMNIEIENDDAMSRAVAEKIEDDVSFNAADYGDDKITFVANDLDGLPPRFRDKANYNNSTRKYEVEVDKSELAKPSKDVSDADYEAFKQGQVNDDVLASIADDISEGRRPTARQLEIYNANKDAINAKVGAEYTAVDPSSNYFGALRKVQKGGVVYAKNKATGRVYEVKTKNALDLAYNSGARITAEKPTRKVSGEFTTQIVYGQKAAERGNRLFNEPIPEVSKIADRYFEATFGRPRPRWYGSRKLDKERAKRIAKAYEEMEDNPLDPMVKAAYEALANETIAQYRYMLDAGYVIEINNEEPYTSSADMIADVRDNKRMKIYSTESGYGNEGITPEQRERNILLHDSGYKDVNGQTLLVNDVFRAVHDFFGHAALGNSFGATGEENAWNLHARMYSPLARQAATAELRGQNSYTNFSGVNERMEALRQEAARLREEGKFDEAAAIVQQVYDTIKFAEQKQGLLPEEFSMVDESDTGDEKFMLIVDGQEVLSPEGVDEFKKFAASVASRIGISVEFINDERALFKGKYIPSKKRAVINLAYANAETVFHEILGHPIIEAMRNDPEYSELYENLKNEIETTELGQEVLSNVKNKYKFEDPDDYIDEAIVTLLGIMTDKVFKEKQNTKLLGMLKEMLKKMASFVQSLVKNDFILLSDIPSNATIKDIATIIGASESKIVLPSEEIGMRDGREMYQVEGWHGSPYEFDKFTTEKMGTGEGAQAFGWGLYFTDLESIAEMYAKQLGALHSVVYANGKEVGYGHPLRDYENFLIDANGDVETVLNELRSIRDEEKALGVMENSRSKARKKAIAFLEKNPRITYSIPRYKYKVTLHKGKTPDQYDWLEWDKPISDLNRNKINSQFEKENLPKEVSDSGANETMRLLGKKTDYKIYRPRPISGSGKDFYNDLTKYFYESGIENPQKEASLFLLRAGIDGVKYPAESIARGVTSDTARGFNYVVFDENAITIDDRTQFQKTSEMEGASQEYVEKVLSTMMDKFNVPYQIVNEPSDSRLGWTSWDSMGNPTVYVNMAQKVGFDTPIHEYGHVFIHMIKNGNKNAWSQILKELKYGDGKQELERVKREYPELDESGAFMEAAASLLGKYGAEQLDPKTGEYRLAEKIWTAVKQVINDFLKASGIKYKLNVAQVPASINAASTLQMLSLLLTDPDFSLTGGGVGMAKVPFQLSAEANNMLQYISNRSETTIVSSDIHENTKFIFSIKSLNRFRNQVVNKRFREKNNKFVEALKNKSDKNLLIDVLKNVRQILDDNKQNSDPLNDGELLRALSELDRLSVHSYGYSDAVSFLGDLFLIYHGNLLKILRNSGRKYRSAILGLMNLQILISGSNFDDVSTQDNKAVLTFLMPNKAEDVFADIISSIELDEITEFTDEDSANQDLVNYIAEDFAALTAMRGFSMTGYAQETYIRVSSGDPINTLAGTYYMATNVSGDFNLSDAIYRNARGLALSEEFDDLILGNIYGFSADYVLVNLLIGDAGKVLPSDDSVIESVKNALTSREKEAYDNSAANQASNYRIGTFEYFHKGTNRMEGIEVTGTYSKYNKSIGINFTNNGPTYSGYTDNKAGMTVMPLVVKKVIEMFSDVEYDSINFTPLSNDGVNQKIKQDSQGRNVNNRLNMYNVYAIRLFGEYSLIKIDDDYQRSIPIPEVFKTKVLRDVVQDQRPSSSNTEWAVNSAPSNVVELAKFLNHAFPGVEVFMSADEFNRMRENGELDMVGEVYGMTKDGKIYINPDVHNSESELFNTLIHEFGHIWLNYIKVHNSALYARGIELVKSTKEYKAELAKGKSPNQAADEALAIIIGNRGAEVVNPKMKNWLKSLWRYITKYLGPIETMTLDDFINTALSDLLSGKPIPQSSEAFEVTLIPNPQFREDRDIIDIVRDARDRGYTDDAIKRYLQINKYEQDDITLFMSGLGNVITNIKSPELMPFPPAFANVPGGYHEGLAVWNRVRTVGVDLYRNRKKRKAIKGQKGLGDTIVDAMMEALKAEPAYINATIDVKKQMMVGLLNSSDIRMSRNMRASLRRLAIEAKSIVRGGKIANTAKAQLVSYIIASLPKSKYTTKEVKSLLEKVKKATTTNMAQIIDEVRDTIATIKNRDLKSSISKMLETKITSKKKGVILGRTTVDAQVLLNALNGGMLMSEDSPAANIEAKIAEQSVALDTLLNEISAQPYEVQEEIQRNIEALTIAVKYNASLLMDDSNDGKTDVLKEVDDELKRILRGERAKFLEDKISKAKRRNELAAIMASDILQVDADELMALIDDKEELDKLKQRLSDRTAKREQRFVQRFIDTIVGFLSGTTEDFTGIINKVSISAVSLFEGLAYDMTVRRISDAQKEYDRLNILTQDMLQDAAKRIFGPKWERVLANNAKQNISFPGFDQKFSVNQLYYIYNQYKNPANQESVLSSFKDAASKYGMSELEFFEYMLDFLARNHPDVIEWADWQVDEYFPAVYELYSPVYERVFGSPLPWERHYAGMLVREGVSSTPEISTLFSEFRLISPTVAGASTKSRVKSKSSIKFMDGDSILKKYTREMNFFASFEEAIRDVASIFNNQLVKKAIEATSGKKVYNSLVTMIERIQGTGYVEDPASFIITGTKQFAIAKLAGNFRVFLSQMTTGMGYVADIGAVKFGVYAGKILGDPFKIKSMVDEMKEYNATLKSRLDGIDLNVLLGALGKTDDNFWIPQKWVQHMMILARLGDKYGILTGLPLYAYYKDKYLKQGVNEESAKKLAAEKFMTITSNVAQSNNPQNKGLTQTASGGIGDSILKSFTLFASQPLQYLRIEIMSIRNMYRILLSTGPKGVKSEEFAKNLRSFIAFHFVMPLFYNYVFLLGMPGILNKWDDDDEKDMILTGILGNITALILIGDVIESFKDWYTGKPWASDMRNTPFLMAAKDIVKSLQDYNRAKSDSKRQSAMIKIAANITDLSGIPAGTTLKYYKIIEEMIDGKSKFGKKIYDLFNMEEEVKKGPPPPPM
jgi:hypothetical protein